MHLLDYSHFIKTFNLDELLSGPVINEISNGMSGPVTLESLFERAIKSPKCVQLDHLVQIRYINQVDGELLGVDESQYDDAKVLALLRRGVDFYSGNIWESECSGVDIEDAYRCGMCEFFDDCEWRKSRC
jgi:exonuclease V